jgi:hypothetical protein
MYCDRDGGTAPGVPIPHPVDVDIIIRLIENRLYGLIHSFPSLNEFIQEMRSDPGINFHVTAADIKPKNLSHMTKGNFTGDAHTVAAADLLRMRLGPSDKYSGTVIATQINFATYAKTYEKLQSYNLTPPSGRFLSLGREMADFATKDLTGVNEGQTIFLSQMNRILSEQIAIPLNERDKGKAENRV